MATLASTRPAHVPEEHLGDFNLMDGPDMLPRPNGEPHAAIARLLDGPPVFYSLNNTRNGEGAWFIIRAEDQRRVLQDGETFSSNRNIFASALGETWPLIPLEVDPPEHAKWRSLLNPLLSPRRVMNLEPFVRQRAAELVEEIKARGNSCEVMTEFAFPFAVSIFLQFLGIPNDRLMEFVGWANDLLHSTPEARTKAARTVIAYLDELQELRRKEPTDDFMSFVTQAEVDEQLANRRTALKNAVAGVDTRRSENIIFQFIIHRFIFKIYSQQLLLLGNNTQLDDGRNRRVPQQGRLHAGILHQRLQRTTSPIITEKLPAPAPNATNTPRVAVKPQVLGSKGTSTQPAANTSVPQNNTGHAP